MSFRLITLETDGTKAFPPVIEKEEDAIGLACDLLKEGLQVLRIADSAGAVVRDADEVRAWCSARRRVKPSRV